jgi:hypothetical protein
MTLTRRRWLELAMGGVMTIGLVGSVAAQGATAPIPAVAAPPELVNELRVGLEAARRRFEARDVNGVLAYVSDRYRSSGFTKASVREHLTTMFSIYDELRARVSVDQVHLVDGTPWMYTTGEINGRLPLLGWSPVLSWQRQPEIVRREGTVWRLFGFQD